MTQIQNKYHTQLSTYFSYQPLYLDEKEEKKPNIRKLIKEYFHQTKAEMRGELTNYFSSLAHIQYEKEIETSIQNLITVWSRLFFDKEPFLKEWDADVVSIINSFQRQYNKILMVRYGIIDKSNYL